MGSAPSSSTLAADLPFFPLPPAAGLRVFLTPAGVATALRERFAGVVVVVDLLGELGVASVWATLRSFFRCSWTARGVQVVVSLVSWGNVRIGI